MRKQHRFMGITSLIAVAFLVIVDRAAMAQVPPPVPIAQPPAGSIDFYLATGSQLSMQQEWEGAIEAYSKALKMDSRSAKALLGRGIAFMGQGDVDNAVKDFRAVVKIAPRSIDAFNGYLLQGQIAQSKGDLPGALAAYDKAIEIRPNDASARNTRAKAREAKGDHDGAIADYAQALTLQPRAAAFYAGRGRARTAKGDFDGAIADLDKSLELSPRESSFAVYRGDARRAMGDLKGALEDYEHAIAWNGRYAPAYVQRGLVKLLQGDEADAKTDFDQALELDPKLAANLQKSIESVKGQRKNNAPAPNRFSDRSP